MNIVDGAKKIFRFVAIEVERHSPAILAGLGITGMVTTTVLAVKGTPEALRRIERKKKELHTDQLTWCDTVKVAWPCYIPAAISGFVSAGSMVGSCIAGNSKSAALATALSASERALEEHMDKVTELFGEGSDERVKEAVKKDKTDVREVIFTGKGACLFYDDLTKRYFISDPTAVGTAFAKMNAELFSFGELDVASYCMHLGLEPREGDYRWVWYREEGCIEPYHDSKLQEDTDIPCHVIGFYPSHKPKERR